MKTLGKRFRGLFRALAVLVSKNHENTLEDDLSGVLGTCGASLGINIVFV